jgi:sugar phosphate isomerase/epimerase
MNTSLPLAIVMTISLASSAWGLSDPATFLGNVGVATNISNADLLAKNGYNYIEEGVVNFLMPTNSEQEFEEMLQKARSAAIPVKACNLFLPGTLKSVGPDATHEKILEYSKTAFRRAEKVGMKFIVFGSGGSRNIPEGFPANEARRQFIELCKKLAPLASQHHVILVLEPLCKEQCNFINLVSEGGKIVEEVNHPNFRLLADFWHMMMENEGPESIEMYGHLIHHTHIAEKEGRTAPGTHGEDFTPYFQALKNVGYKGMISIESNWDDMDKRAGPAIETIRAQLSRLK